MHKRIKILDSLRGIAALIVLFHHLFKLNIDFFQEKFSTSFFKILNLISGLNHEAVMFFFILSGFSIGLSLRNKNLNTKLTLNEYLYRRFKRILPIYWLALLFALIIGFLLNQTNLNDYSFYNLVGNILFLQTSSSGTEAWFVPYGVNGPLWSLSFEMFFYLFFPFVYFINYQYFRGKNVFLKFSMLIVLSLMAIVFNKKVFFVPYLLFLTGFVTWILGYLSSQYFLYKKNYTRFFVIVLFMGILILFFKNSIPSDTVHVLGKGLFINGLFYFAIHFFEKFRSSKLEHTLNFIFFKIGEGSYAIYALHYPLLILLAREKVAIINQILIILVFMVLCIYLERLTIRFKWKFLEIDYFKIFK